MDTLRESERRLSGDAFIEKSLNLSGTGALAISTPPVEPNLANGERFYSLHTTTDHLRQVTVRRWRKSRDLDIIIDVRNPRTNKWTRRTYTMSGGSAADLINALTMTSALSQ